MNKVRLLGLIFMIGLFFPKAVYAHEQEPVVMEEIVDTSEHIYSYAEMMEDIDLLGKKFPHLLQVSSVGTSVDNRMIFQIVMGNPNARNAIYIQSTIHGREWMNTWILMKSLEECLNRWNQMAPNGETYGQVFEDCCIYLLPMVNPDGVSISQFGMAGILNEALRNYCSALKGADKPARWKANANGVDLNRQFSVGWNSQIDQTAPCSEYYNGVAPFTEPEALAVKQALEQREFVAAVTYHSSEGAIYWNLGQQEEMGYRNLVLATHCQNITGYRLDMEMSKLKGLEYNYIVWEKGIPAVCIETGTTYSPLPYSQWHMLWQENSMLMVALAACYQ